MAIYFLLGKLTEEGQRKLYDNPEAVSDVAATMNVQGAQILGQYAVLGHYDYIVMAVAEENEPIARLSSEFGRRTGLHVETLSGVSVGFLAPHEHGSTIQDDTGVEMDQPVGIHEPADHGAGT